MGRTASSQSIKYQPVCNFVHNDKLYDLNKIYETKDFDSKKDIDYLLSNNYIREVKDNEQGVVTTQVIKGTEGQVLTTPQDPPPAQAPGVTVTEKDKDKPKDK